MKSVHNLFTKTILKTRFLFYSTLFFLDSVLKFRTKVIILCYHSVSSDTWDFSVSLVEFKRQIEYLENEIKRIRNTTAFRLGKGLLYPVKKIKVLLNRF